MNTITPRIFVAATRQNDGKTTIALGLFAALKRRFGRIGFIKPVAQRYIEIDGKNIDEDSLLMDRTFGVQIPLEDMSPIAIEPNFTRRYIEKSNNDFLVRRLRNSFDRASWEREFTIIEGSGHAGVGAVFDLSNARVASLLQSKVVLVTRGGIGSSIDEVALNKALFDQEGVELVGVIMNKVTTEKYEHVRDFAQRGLKRLGIDLLGVLPKEPLLSDASLGQICQEVQGKFMDSQHHERRRVRRIIIGAMSSSHVMEYFTPGTLVITPGDREDVILAALSTSALADGDQKKIAGLILSGDLFPHQTVLDLIRASDLPVIGSPLDSYTTAHSIYAMTVKTLPDDKEKIDRIQNLVETHVDIDLLVEKLRA